MKKLLMWVALLLVVLTVARADARSAIPEVTTKELAAAVKTHTVVLLDCNGTDSFQKAHIPGAIDFDANKNNLQSLLPASKDALIVAYCGGPTCPMYKAGAATAIALGYTNVKHFAGGISGWMAAKQPTASGSH